MSSRITDWRIGYARLDYVRPVHWAAHSEDHGDVIVIELTTGDGLRGAAEAIMRPKWHDTTMEDVENILTQTILPGLLAIDWQSTAVLQAFLTRYRTHAFAVALVDQAIWDLRAQQAQKPLWQMLGARSSSVDVSFTLTRTEPAIMAREAEAMRAQFGFSAFKVKTGQGIDIDRRAIADIRASVGSDVIIMADSNRAHDSADVARMSEMLAEAGVIYFEDPCAFTADQSFVAAQAASVLPILVDNQSRSIESARTFVSFGAKALSVKTMKTGISESLAIMDFARTSKVKVAVGLSASCGAGAIHTLSLAAALPAELFCLACEETFFLYLKRDLIETPLQVRNGKVDLSGFMSIASQIDWKRMDSILRG